MCDAIAGRTLPEVRFDSESLGFPAGADVDFAARLSAGSTDIPRRYDRLHAPRGGRGGVALPVLRGRAAARGADVTGNAAFAGIGCRPAGTRLPGAAVSRTNTPMHDGRGQCRCLIGRGCAARHLAAARRSVDAPRQRYVPQFAPVDRRAKQPPIAIASPAVQSNKVYLSQETFVIQISSVARQINANR